MGMSDAFRRLVRGALGLPDDPGEPPELFRLGLYRATVQSAASDGSKVDVQPTDGRIAGEKNVRVRVGIPGAVAVVQPGAVVLLGWEGGDPSKPYAVPSWEGGATVLKLELTATEIDITGNTTVKINSGTLGAARQTDQVTGTAGPYPISSGQIAGGSSTVKIG